MNNNSNPVFGVILSAIFLKEGSVLGIISILSLILTATGIFIVNHHTGATKSITPKKEVRYMLLNQVPEQIISLIFFMTGRIISLLAQCRLQLKTVQVIPGKRL